MGTLNSAKNLQIGHLINLYSTRLRINYMHRRSSHDSPTTYTILKAQKYRSNPLCSEFRIKDIFVASEERWSKMQNFGGLWVTVAEWCHHEVYGCQWTNHRLTELKTIKMYLFIIVFLPKICAMCMCLKIDNRISDYFFNIPSTPPKCTEKYFCGREIF